jgi:hypothetical protein
MPQTITAAPPPHRTQHGRNEPQQIAGTTDRDHAPAIPPSVPAPHMKLMTMTTTTTIADDWRCHALEPRHDRHGRRCEASGVRYRDGGQWVCLRHMDTAVNEYCGGDRDEAGR